MAGFYLSTTGADMKRLFGLLVLGLALALPQAYAGMIATDAAQAQDERSRVKAMLERPEAVQELQKMGVPPAQAAARVEAMNDAEVRQIAGRLDALPAGGQMSNQNLLLLIIIILLIVIIL
jgi:hypothetical protein